MRGIDPPSRQGGGKGLPRRHARCRGRARQPDHAGHPRGADALLRHQAALRALASRRGDAQQGQARAHRRRERGAAAGSAEGPDPPPTRGRLAAPDVAARHDGLAGAQVIRRLVERTATRCSSRSRRASRTRARTCRGASPFEQLLRADAARPAAARAAARRGRGRAGPRGGAVGHCPPRWPRPRRPRQRTRRRWRCTRRSARREAQKDEQARRVVAYRRSWRRPRASASS